MLPYKRAVVAFIFNYFCDFCHVVFLQSSNNFDEFVKTTHYSFSYSIFIMIVLAILSILEFIISFHPSIKAFSFAVNYFLFLAIPFILLCNLNLDPKRTNYKYILPSWMLIHYSLFVISILWLVIKVLEFVEIIFI